MVSEFPVDIGLTLILFFRLNETDVDGVITEVTKGRQVVSQEEFIHVSDSHTIQCFPNFFVGMRYIERPGYVSTALSKRHKESGSQEDTSRKKWWRRLGLDIHSLLC